MMQLHNRKTPTKQILQCSKMNVLCKVITLLYSAFVARVPGKSW